MKVVAKIFLSSLWGGALFASLHPFVPHEEIELPLLAAAITPLPQRHDVIETLSSPIPVLGWTQDGFISREGEIVPLPGIESLPLRFPILHEIVRHGIEIDPVEHRIFGLLTIDHHECGNDPIRQHLARVDVGGILEFLQGYDNSYRDCASMEEWKEDRWGWSAGCFYAFERWMTERRQSK